MEAEGRAAAGMAARRDAGAVWQSWAEPTCPPFAPAAGIANTGVLRWAGKLLALYEVGGWVGPVEWATC